MRLAFNVKNSVGGYNGFKPYAIGFKDGRVNLHVFTMKLSGADALDTMINDSILKQFANCTPVADAKVQELLAEPIAGGS